MTFELKLFAVSVYENKLCFEFKNKLRAIHPQHSKILEKVFIHFDIFVKNFALAQIFMFV